MSKMTDAIAAHRAAWQAFQDAPDYVPGGAEDRETEALMTLLSTRATSRLDLAALYDHLNWYCAEEGEQAGGAARAALAGLQLMLPVAAKAKALVDAVDFDNNGAMVAGKLVGGNGGLISRETIKAADELRKALAVAP